MPEFEEIDSESTVFRVTVDDEITPINYPTKAKSKFAEERDVSYHDCRATVVENEKQMFVIVGECRDW